MCTVLFDLSLLSTNGSIACIIGVELIYYFTYFSQSSYLTLVCFFPVGLSLLIQHFQQVLEVSSVSWLGQLIVNCPSQETEETSRPVENVVLTMKGLQERNTQVFDGTVKNR